MNAYLGYIIFFAVAICLVAVLLTTWIYLHKFPRTKKVRDVLENMGDSIIDNIPIV